MINCIKFHIYLVQLGEFKARSGASDQLRQLRHGRTLRIRSGTVLRIRAAQAAQAAQALRIEVRG